MMKEYDCNPKGLPDGSGCFGVCVTAFRPQNAGTSVDRADYRQVFRGTYRDHRFRPDMLVDGTNPQSLIYFQVNWVMFPEKSDAEAFRAVLAEEYAQAEPGHRGEMAGYAVKA